MLMLLDKVVPLDSSRLVPPLKLRVPLPLTSRVAEAYPGRKVRPPELVRVIAALMTMSLAALSVSMLPPPAVIAEFTVIVPACVPVVPVKTVTLLLLNALVSVLTLMMALSPVAVCPLTLLSLPVLMVMLRGSNNHSPDRPPAASLACVVMVMPSTFRS